MPGILQVLTIIITTIITIIIQRMTKFHLPIVAKGCSLCGAED